MNNGTSEKVIEFFNTAAALPDKWDHNRQYQGYMLRQINASCDLASCGPARCGPALDIGCGTGEFCKILAQKCGRVIGIDVAPKMIETAKKRNAASSIEYILTDADTFLDKSADTFDVIVSIAAFHHMDYQKILSKCKKALKSGGILVIQDLYKENTLIFKLLSLIGAIANPFFMLVKNGRLSVSKEERSIWAMHSDDDIYNTIKEISDVASKVLGKFCLKRHLFWRYTLVYHKK